MDPSLVEGVHYSLMSYGGRLVTDLTIADPDLVDEVAHDLTKLVHISRRSTLIADSDKTSETGELPEVVQRLQQEATDSETGHVIVCDWVRTVECLIPRRAFREACIRLHPKAGQRLKTAAKHHDFDDPFRGMKAFSKTRVAAEITKSLAQDDLDERLRPVVEGLARRIRQASGLAAVEDDEQI